jgi:hypothetical protein
VQQFLIYIREWTPILEHSGCKSAARLRHLEIGVLFYNGWEKRDEMSSTKESDNNAKDKAWYRIAVVSYCMLYLFLLFLCVGTFLGNKDLVGTRNALPVPMYMFMAGFVLIEGIRIVFNYIALGVSPKDQNTILTRLIGSL